MAMVFLWVDNVWGGLRFFTTTSSFSIGEGLFLKTRNAMELGMEMYLVVHGSRLPLFLSPSFLFVFFLSFFLFSVFLLEKQKV